MRQKIVSVSLACILCLGMAVPAYAAEQPAEIEAAGAYLRERGVYQGDGSGSLMLDKGLTRAEMAALLTRLHGEGAVNPDHYTWACYFTDVPAWAKPYVGYCTANLLVAGYDSSRYGPNDPVTPAMACTVILRCYGYEDGEGSVWSYGTACQYAVSLGWISQSTAQASMITRGEMAVLIRRALTREEAPPAKPEPIFQVDGVTIAQDGTITGKTATASDWSREDFSQLANPAVFTGCYTRGWYNALRQSIADRDIIVEGNKDNGFNPKYLYAHTLVPDTSAEALSTFSYVLGRIYGYYSYSLGAEPYLKNQYEYPGYTIIQVTPLRHDTGTLAFIQPELDHIAGMDERGKVIELNRYLCGLMEYRAGAVGSVDEIFSAHAAPVPGRCASYSSAFSFLCDLAGIPCIRVASVDHSWNEVYVDGQWLSVDVSSNDISANQDAYLLTTRLPDIDQHPEATRFARELLVPGSTK